MAIVIIALIAAFSGTKEQNDYLRIHIRANSNEIADQQIKLKVKDEVVKYLTPVLADCETKQKAFSSISKNLKNIECIANNVLAHNNYSYTAKASLSRENFPTRSYDGFTLSEGVYDALIISLGSAEGNNWWCVVYPPLCFVGGENTGGDMKYVSKLKEIIESFKR